VTGRLHLSDVERYYDQQARYEWERFDRHRIEFAVTLRALAEHLPPLPARVLDVGGGPGRYTIELARRGYAVTDLDLSTVSLEFAAAQAAEVERLPEGAWSAWLDLHYRLGQDPCLLGAAAHLLYVGRKPASRDAG
jgi:SAM-dependent methyltransferase